MTLRTLALTIPLATMALLAAAPAQATSMYIPPPSSCTGSYCGPGEGACYQNLCVGPITWVDFQCTEACDLSEECALAPGTCETVFPIVSDVASTPVGTCTFTYCGWEDDACVEVGTATCYDVPPVQRPATCVGSMCDGEYACAWSEWTPDGVCDSDVVVCGPLTCPLMPDLNAGACAGSPQSYGWEENPDCDGGILCLDGPSTKPFNLNEACLVFYWVS